MIKNISNLGDAALYCDFGKEVNKDTNILVIRYFKSIQNKNILGVNNLTPSYNKLIISFDLQKTNFRTLKKEIENLDIADGESISNKKIEIIWDSVVEEVIGDNEPKNVKGLKIKNVKTNKIIINS